MNMKYRARESKETPPHLACLQPCIIRLDPTIGDWTHWHRIQRTQRVSISQNNSAARFVGIMTGCALWACHLLEFCSGRMRANRRLIFWPECLYHHHHQFIISPTVWYQLTMDIRRLYVLVEYFRLLGISLTPSM